MPEKHSIAEARSNLAKLVREAEQGRAVELTRHGESVAVIVGRRQFEQLTSGSRGFSAAFRDFCVEFDREALDIDPDQFFGDVRDNSDGRDVRL